MKHFGLIGHPVGHSWSKKIHEEYYQANGIDASYELIDLADIKDFKKVMENMDGVNVTIPYKKSIIPLLDWISNEAKEIGAVNTIVNRNGKLYGYNTDVTGFRKMAAGIDGKRILILGDGGAAQAVKYVLKEMKCTYRSVSHQEMNEGLICTNGYDVVVNTTPLGMFPKVDKYPPLDYDNVQEGMFFLDLVYNPEETAFMRRGITHSATAIGGLTMLKEQAFEAIKLFTIDNLPLA